jgi:hypothetical protein
LQDHQLIKPLLGLNSVILPYHAEVLDRLEIAALDSNSGSGEHLGSQVTLSCLVLVQFIDYQA